MEKRIGKIMLILSAVFWIVAAIWLIGMPLSEIWQIELPVEISFSQFVGSVVLGGPFLGLYRIIDLLEKR